MGYCYFKDNNHKPFDSLDITKDPAHRRINAISPIAIAHQPDALRIINTERILQSNSYKHKLQKYFPHINSNNNDNSGNSSPINQLNLQLNIDTFNGIDSGRTDFNEPINIASPSKPNNIKQLSPLNNSAYSFIFSGNYPLTTSPSSPKLKSPRKSN